MSDLPDRLWSAAWNETPREELTDLLCEAASRIVVLEWWHNTHKELLAKRKARQPAGQSDTQPPAPTPPPSPE